jgi:PAS domain S-box-containing protein
MLFSLKSHAQDSIRTLKVGADYAYYPYEFINEVHQPDGFDIDIIKAIGKEINMDISIKPGNWFMVKKEIEQGKLDMVAGMYYLPDRAEKVNFSMPYIIITHSIFVKEGDYWQSLKDVKDQKDLKVVVENSSILHKYLTTAGVSSSRIIPVENQLDALKILSETPNTCALLPDLQGKYIARKNGYPHIVTVGLPILPREYSVAINKKDTALLNKVNDAITTINKNGIYKKIYNKWFGNYKNPNKSYIELSKLEMGLITILILTLLFFAYWFNKLKKSVQRKEEQLNLELFHKQKLNTELIKNETILRKITENTPYPIAMVNAEGFFIYVNRRFEDEFGYSRKEIYNIEQWINIFFSNKDYQAKVKERLEQRIKNISDGKETETCNTEHFNVNINNENEKIIIIQIVSLGDGQLLFFFENITERIENERKLKEARQKAEVADKLKSSFLANISHEIRTPMNSIIGFSSLLSEDDINPKEKMLYSSLIRKNGNVLMLLIQDIIDFSKIEAGELNIYPKIIDLSQTILDTFNTIKEDHGVKIPNPINFKLLLPPESEHTKYFVRVDPNRLTQVLINILNNSFKYTDKGVIEYGFQEIDNNKIRIYVKDTGIGIRKEEQEFIFKRFTRVESEKALMRGGTGLGLAISYQILKLFGSELFVKSEEQKGSTFYFDLNYYTGLGEKIEENTSYSTKTATDYHWADKNILIIEDNKENATFLEAALRKTKCYIVVAETGAEAIKMLNNTHFNLIILDWMLPDISGEIMAKNIKKDYKIPIVVITALAMIEDKNKILRRNVDAYFAKPVDKSELLEKINHLLINS